MGLTGIQIFKMTPKKNCKECGCPTCMAFAMKVAQGALEISKCPHMSDEALAELSEATAPPMKTIKVGAGDNEYTLGGETVLFRHEKTFVSKTRYAVALCTCMDDAAVDAKLAELQKVDYERIGERMYVEAIYVNYEEGSDKDRYVEMVKKATATGRTLVLGCTDVEVAKAAGVVLGVAGADLNEIYDTVAALEKAGNKNLVIDATGATVKEAYGNAVQIRRAALKDQDRTFGYPTIVNLAKVAHGDRHLQQALASLFTVKYGSIVVMETLDYAEALPLFGLRQNVFTDPQKPMKVEPGVYPLNGADENSICLTTVDFALTYFVVSGELERSGVPCNLIISDAGGLSVLTAWAAGKLSSTSVAKYIQENVEDKVKSRKLVIPGKVAVLKGDIEAKLPGWEIIVGPMEAVQLVKFLKDLTA